MRTTRKYNANIRTYTNSANVKRKFALFAFHSRRSRYEGGFGLIEIVVVTAIVITALFSFLEAGTLSVKLLQGEKENLEATLLAKEAMEAVRSLRDESWTNNISSLLNATNYYPVVENGKWKLATTDPGIINGKYTRLVIFDQVLRDAQDKIASSGTLDSGTRKVTTRVTWSKRSAPATKEFVTYLTNFQGSLGLPQESKTISFEGATTDADLISFPGNVGNGDPAQSFTTASALQATKVELFLKRTTSAPSDVYVELRASPIGKILGTSNIINSSTIVNSGLSWAGFRFPNPISLSAATTYYIRLRSTPASTDVSSGAAGALNWGYQQTSGSPYSGGDARRYVGRLSNLNDAGQLLDQYDFGFRVYALQ